MEQKRIVWQGIWGRDTDQLAELLCQLERHHGLARLQLQAAGPITAVTLRAAIKETPAGTGLGYDKLVPAVLAGLDEVGLSEFTALVNDVEYAMLLPSSAFLQKVVLLGKSDGGDRPICLMAFVHRLIRQWDLAHAGPWDKAMPGQGGGHSGV